ncbi:MAG TPA: type II/IV secretion system protein, partial [Nitratifractor sp.]|nr:type II/IV secretion system protein [Nitratifractor sp.]
LSKEDVNSVELYEFIAQNLNIEYIDLQNIEIDSSLLDKIPTSILLKNRIVITEEDDIYIHVVFADPFDMAAQDAVSRFFPNKIIKKALSSFESINEKLMQIETYESLKIYIQDIKEDLKSTSHNDEDESPAVLKLIELILKSSILARASDIHIEVSEKNCIVRDRIDGMLQQRFIFDKTIFGPLSSRIKLLSNLDIAEKRKPQDGRFSAKVVEKEYDFRVSTLPTLIGESIVLRILDKSKALITLEQMGMSDQNYKEFNSAIKAPYGIVLVTGPTGSGKTTTLYGALNAIKSVQDKIITVEDPVEYQMNGIQQVQVNSAADLTFASSLRSILRQDPDKIMIGEIRDTETLRIAIQAAMTGHLVLSTLHTNSAISAIYRMVDMGIESYLVSGSLIAIQAQRLVRKTCPYCKELETIEDSLLESIMREVSFSEVPQFYRGKGCKQCYNTGYLGREMISEVLTISSEMARLIASQAHEEELEKLAKQEGFVPMFHNGIIKATEGKTTIEEIFRVARL